MLKVSGFLLLALALSAAASPSKECNLCLSFTAAAEKVLEDVGNMPFSLLVDIGEVLCKGHENSTILQNCYEFFKANGKLLIDGLMETRTPNGVCNHFGFCNVPEQVHISMEGTPSTQINVMWVTPKNTTTHTVWYGQSEDSLNQMEEGYTTTYTDGGWEGVIHIVELDQLSPLTRYYYVVGDATDGKSKVFSFVTPPTSKEAKPSSSIIVIGDMGADPLADASVKSMTKRVQNGEIDLLVHDGDMSYANGVMRVWDQYLRKIEAISASVPYMVSPGNHENHYQFAAYLHRFTMPWKASGAINNLYHSFDYSNIHFVAFNLEYDLSPSSAQYAWLENDLKVAESRRQNGEIDWIVAYGHRPLYCSNYPEDKSDCWEEAPKFRSWLEGMFAQYGVDLVVGAHEHSYEAIHPVYNTTVDEASISYIDNNHAKRRYTQPKYPVYIVDGSAGCKEFLDVKFKSPAPSWSANHASYYGYGMLNVEGSSRLSFTYIRSEDDAELDYFEIVH
uniref:Purple acid phosphatase n=1 Tax=Palpitomonas bilix TaxID=652834 RepID=A0A7S3D1E3_9EUKA|mmetsp:Transcript_18308/g.45860  ORF Transcript_18308/g.45860 Transcript_18308/m.45860 type:complete len:505 (+) Transcript_18308:40-1554(+)